MPLSELLYRMAKGKMDASSQAKNPSCSTADLSFVPENDFAELVWEHGQIHSSRARKVQNSNSLPSQSPKTRDRDSGNGSNSRIGKFGVVESVINDIPISVPAVDMGLNQDDDMVPWLSYPIDESLQNGYGSEFLTELSGVTVNEHPQNNFTAFDERSSAGPSIRNSHSVRVHNSLSLEQENSSRLSSAGDGDDTRPRPSESHLYSSQSQHCQTSFPHFRSRILSNNNDDSTRSSNYNSVSGDGIRIPTSGDGFPSSKTRVQPLLPSSTSPNSMNFSHFSRPALGKANLLNFNATAGSRISRTERMEGKDKGSIQSSSNPTDSTHMDSCSRPRMETSSSCHPISLSSRADAKSLEGKPAEVRVPPDLPEAVCLRDENKNDWNCSQNFGESGTKGLVDGDKTVEPVVASSSVCSGNSVERASDDPNHNLKRKHRDTEESEGPSDDVEEESVAAKNAPPAKGGTGSKRSRAAEVHNLSERRRRDRINEKMRALQELIPNCNKVDKASMLDEAIEYLKTLQLQVQIMSMGAGLYMPPMMMQPGMPPIHAAHMPHFSPLGVGIGMGMGFGIGMPDMNGGSMIQVPPMHGALFPGPSVPGPTAFHGMGGSNLQMFGISGQGLQVPYPRGPVMPLSGGPLLKPAMGMQGPGAVGPSDNLDSAPVSSSKDSVENLNSKAMQSSSINNNSVNQTSRQGQATNDGLLQQPTLLQNNGQAPEVNENGGLKSVTGNGDETGRAVGSD